MANPIVGQPAERGASPLLYAAASPELDGRSLAKPARVLTDVANQELQNVVPHNSGTNALPCRAATQPSVCM